MRRALGSLQRQVRAPGRMSDAKAAGRQQPALARQRLLRGEGTWVGRVRCLRQWSARVGVRQHRVRSRELWVFFFSCLLSRAESWRNKRADSITVTVPSRFFFFFFCRWWLRGAPHRVLSQG